MLSSRDADDVPVMNCKDAREGLSALSRYGMGLTEWVLADAHVRQCAECRKALENLQELESAGQRVAPHYISELFARTAGIVVAGTGSVIARCADVLGWPRSFRWVTRAAVGVIEPTRAAGSRSLALFIQIGVSLPILVTVFGRAAARLIGRVVTGFAHRLLWCCSSLRVLFRRAAQAAFKVARTAVRLSEGVSSNAAEATRSVIIFAGRRIAVGHARVRRVVDGLMRVDLSRVFALAERAGAAAIEATWVIGRMVLTTSRRAVRLLGRRAWTSSILKRDGNRATTIGQLSSSVRALATWRLSSTALSIFLKAMLRAPFLSKGHRLGLGTGVACLAALVAVTLFLWPRPRPADLAARFAPAPLSQHGRQPADPTLAELVIAAPLAETSVASSISSLQTVPHPRPKTHSEAIRPRLPEAQAATPAPSRRREPISARGSASAPVPKPSWSGLELRSQEGSDGSAAIDWLVKREKPVRTESP